MNSKKALSIIIYLFRSILGDDPGSATIDDVMCLCPPTHTGETTP